MKDFAVKIFLSYGKEDIKLAEKLYGNLCGLGCDVWWDRESLFGGERWRSTIRNAMKNSRYFVALLSSRVVSRRGFVHSEIRTALEILDEYPDQSIYLIPVRLDECRPMDGILQDLQWIDMFPVWDEGLSMLARSLELVQKPIKRNFFSQLPFCPQCGNRKIRLLIVQNYNDLGQFLECDKCDWTSDLFDHRDMTESEYKSILERFTPALFINKTNVEGVRESREVDAEWIVNYLKYV